MRLNRKNKFLIFGFVVLLYISYRFAIQNTITYYRNYAAKKEMIQNENLTAQAGVLLLQREKQLDTLLSKYNITASESFQNDLLKELTAYSSAYNLKIIDFKEPHIINDSIATTTSYIFTISGSFNGSIALINKIENNPALGIVKHLEFIKKKNYKTNADELFAEVILQQNKGR